jgi:hypothetical protein
VRSLIGCLLGLALVACGERGEAQIGEKIRRYTEELTPEVERAVGLPFKEPPRVELRSREQVAAYMARKLDDELPPEKLEGMGAAYRLFGLLPDTLDLRQLLLSLYTEQVVGYYDPDSATLYVVEGVDPMLVRLTLAHELVHALQGQYLTLDSLLAIPGANDRRMATQAVLEGQATLASIEVLMPKRDFDAIPNFWDTYRQQLKRQHAQMPVFSAAPLIVQETIVFPYLEGANFVRWFKRSFRDTVPFGPRMPLSTEHILHPDRYLRRDEPVDFRIIDEAGLVYSDGLGEFETRVLLTVLMGSEATARAGARSWGGDRYGVYRAQGSEYALVWWTAWDDEKAADRFATLLERGWQRNARGVRRFMVERTPVGGRPGVRLIDAPASWGGWESPPRAVR